MRRALSILIYLIILIPAAAFAGEMQDFYELEPIVVAPYRRAASLYSSNRSVEVIEGRPFGSIPEALSHTSGVDVRRRGAFGV